MRMNKQPHTDTNTDESKALASKVLERIAGENVVPRARWHFLLHNSVLWSLWVGSIVIGAMAVAASIFTVANFQWGFYQATHDTLFEFVVESLPYLWIVALGLFTFVAYQNVRHTKRGYRYPLWIIVGLNITGSCFGGMFLYAVGGGQFVDETIGEHIPLHQPFMAVERGRWMQPERGLIAGEVVIINEEEGTLVLRSFDGDEWQVETTSLHEPDWDALNDFTQVRIVGVPVLESGMHLLHACFVLPWKVHGRMGGGPPPPKEGVRSIVMHFIEHERNEMAERSNECKDVRLYDTLQESRQIPVINY
jgi:hypothetical protein